MEVPSLLEATAASRTTPTSQTSHASTILALPIHMVIRTPLEATTRTSHLPATRSHLPATTSRLLATTSRPPPTRSRLPPTRSHPPPTRSHLPPTRNRPPPTTSHLPATRSHLLATRSRPPPTRNHLPATTSRLPATIRTSQATMVRALPVPTAVAPSLATRTEGWVTCAQGMQMDSVLIVL